VATPITINGVPVTTTAHRSFLGNVEHIGGQFVNDLIDAFTGSAGAMIHGSEYAFTHNPIDTLSQLPRIGEAMGQQMWTDVQHPLRHPGNTFLDALTFLPIPGAIAGRAALLAGTAARGGRLAADLAEATRPALAAGDLAGAREIARSMGRGDEFSRAISPSGEAVPYAKQIGLDITRGAPRQERLLRTPEGDVVHGWIYSRDPTIKAAQKLVDRAYDHWTANGRAAPPPVWRALPPFWRSQSSRVSRAATAANIQRTTSLGSEAQSLWKQFKNVPDGMHLAARMVLEGVTPEEFAKYHTDVLAGRHPDVKVTPRIEKETQRRLGLLPEAQQYLQNVTHDIVGDDGVTRSYQVPEIAPQFHGTTIDKYVDQIRTMSNERSTAFVGADVLSPASEIARTIAPKHEMMYKELPLYEESLQHNIKKLAGVQRLHPNDPAVWQRMQDTIKRAQENPLMPQDVAEKLIQKANLARVHYDLPPLAKIRNLGTVGFRSAYRGHGKPGAPGTITHPYKAEILRGGGGDINTARVMAQTYTEAQRYIALHQNWQRILGSLQETPDLIPERYRTLVRKPGLPNVMTRTQADRFMQRAGETEDLSKSEAEALGMNYEETRQGLFPKRIWDRAAQEFRDVIGMAKNNETAPHGYGWADSRLLGGLDKQNPLIGLLSASPVARGIVRSIDAINTINKTAMLYLKPAYILPNALGNVALNLVQQGFMMPYNLGKSLFVWNRLPQEARQRLLSGMGEGGAQVIGDVSGTAFNRIQQGSRWLSRKYGKVVDEPFRVSSFLHEAAVAGFTSKDDILHLLKDPKLRDQFNDIAQRANDAIINYEFLSPNEQAIMRRLIFFYPWIKGATRYAAQVYKEHPIATGLQAQGGRLENKRTEEMLGALPADLRGIFALHGMNPKTGVAQTQNPNAFSILETPAHVAEEFLNIVERNPNAALNFASEMSPSDRAMLDIITGGITGQNQSGKVLKTQSPLRTAWNDLTGTDAIRTLVRHLRNQAKPTAIYPNQNWIRDLLQFGVWGNLGPRATNVPMANYIAWLEKHPHG